MPGTMLAASPWAPSVSAPVLSPPLPSWLSKSSCTCGPVFFDSHGQSQLCHLPGRAREAQLPESWCRTA